MVLLSFFSFFFFFGSHLHLLWFGLYIERGSGLQRLELVGDRNRCFCVYRPVAWGRIRFGYYFAATTGELSQIRQAFPSFILEP